MRVDPKKQTTKENYKLLIGSILPRPIAFVSTISAKGIPNLAPFSFFTGITANPPTLCFAVARRGKESVKKDTLANIEETREFVVNIVTEEIAEPMNKTGRDFPPEIDEFVEAGLTPQASSIVKPPRVKESPLNMECRLRQIVEIGADEPGAGSLVIGEVVLYHIDDKLYKDGRIDTKLLRPVGRLAGNDYTTLGKIFSFS